MSNPVQLSLTELGYDAHFEALAADADLPHAFPARVCSAHKGGFELLAPQGHFLGQLRGKRRLSGQGAVAVGDWVLATRREKETSAAIEAVLPRRTTFARQAPGGYEGEKQIIAANVDVIFLVTGLDQDFNLRRIERFLALVRESGAGPVVVLTKKDTAPDAALRVGQAQAAMGSVPVHAVSGISGDGVDALRSYFLPHRTVALLGSSGVGKSTLANALLGHEALAVGGTKSDGKGRHTTSRRELIRLPHGGLILDTPGLREIQLTEGASVAEAFDDIEALAPGCKFSDCRHVTEPGCAVRVAAESGALPDTRYQSFLKLQRERDARASWKAQAPGGGVGRVARQRKHQRAK
jgi:ribosome biogenesis GTPase / thiamine phosphate phosphatase